MFAGNFAPANWSFCNGALLPISEFETLFNLIGTTYGGDGQETFGLPDLRGRIPMHVGNSFTQAAASGVESVLLTTPQLPLHNHPAQADTGGGTSPDPTSRIWAADPAAVNQFASPGGFSAMAATTANTGNAVAHENRVPFVCVSFIISLFGIFPTAS